MVMSFAPTYRVLQRKVCRGHVLQLDPQLSGYQEKRALVGEEARPHGLLLLLDQAHDLLSGNFRPAPENLINQGIEIVHV